jgi:hypothetical protein
VRGDREEEEKRVRGEWDEDPGRGKVRGGGKDERRTIGGGKERKRSRRVAVSNQFLAH